MPDDVRQLLVKWAEKLMPGDFNFQVVIFGMYKQADSKTKKAMLREARQKLRV